MDDPEKILEQKSTKSLVERLLKDSGLSEIERTVLRMRYGLDTNEDAPPSLIHMGERLGMSSEKVRYTEREARRKAAQWLARNGIRGLEYA